VNNDNQNTTPLHAYGVAALTLALAACAEPTASRSAWVSEIYPTLERVPVLDGRRPNTKEQAAIDATMSCLSDLPTTPPKACLPMPGAEVVLDSDALRVVIVQDYDLSRAGEQVLPWLAPCDPNKSNPDGTCHWRALVRGDVLVLTPDLRMLPDVVVRWATTCTNPWAVPELAACAMPLQR